MTKAKFQLTEQNYRYLFENANDAMWVQDMEGNIVDANKACERLSGSTRQEFLGGNVREFVTGESLNLAREVRRKLLAGEDISQPYEQRLVRKDGTIVTLKMATSLVTIDGVAMGFQNVARDITGEKRLQEMLSNVINGSPIATFVIDREHRITHWNTAIASLTGASSENMVGTDTQWRTFYAEKRPTMADLIADGATPEIIEARYSGKCKKSQLIDGAYEAEDFFPAVAEHGAWLRFTASPIMNEDGEILAAIETLQEISEEKQLQENIHYYAQLITKAQEEERKRLARELHDEISSSLILITQRLDVILSTNRLRQTLKEKLESLRTQIVDALAYLRRYAQDLRPRILDDLGLMPALEWMAEDMESHFNIKTTVEVTGTPRILPAEAQMLVFRIAQQALGNTRRHAEASRASVKVEFGENRLTMTVTDDGKGFVVPQRIEDLASAGRLGIMGMAERARLLNGSLEVKAEPGKGTRVIAELPL